MSDESATKTAQPTREKRHYTSSLRAHGTPMVWLTGGALAISVAMIMVLLAFVFWQGFSTFWPFPVVKVVTDSGGTFMGEVTRESIYFPGPETVASLSPDAREILQKNDGRSHRRLLRTGNFELTNIHFNWVSDYQVRQETRPRWALVFERTTWGRFYGTPLSFTIGTDVVATEPAAVWQQFRQHHPMVRRAWHKKYGLEKKEIGAVNHAIEKERLALRAVELAHGKNSAAWRTANESYLKRELELKARFQALRNEIETIDRDNARYVITVETVDGVKKEIALDQVVRAYPANNMGFWGKTGIYLSRWTEFLLNDPREANSEGGVFPAIFGTVIMTLIMSLAVVPFGVLAALYLREYAKSGPMVSAVRISINNLAGVPSIVFGVFGLGFFCYIIGVNIDQLFFAEKLPNPTYGTGGILWSALTLALLTVPVVIVATEEALSAVPNSMREGSYACGASKWQTIRRIILPRAMPGVMTGMILAMARGAGEVAPLMLVGAVKLAPEMPVDGFAPFIHLERSFMHLGFHIYDLGFQSQNSEAAKPMVYTTTFLLIALIFILNIVGVKLRTSLRKKFLSSAF